MFIIIYCDCQNKNVAWKRNPECTIYVSQLMKKYLPDIIEQVIEQFTHFNTFEGRDKSSFALNRRKRGPKQQLYGNILLM